MPPDDGTAFSPRAFRRSLRRAGITLTQYRVAVELCEYATQDKSVVWPSVAVLAEDCELGRRTVIYALNELESKGVIACDDGGRKGGRGCATRWRLIIKGAAPCTLYDGERVHRQTERVHAAVKKGAPPCTRSSKEEGEKRGAADATPSPPPKNERPNDCCPQHESGPIEDCDACDRAWRRAENWDFGRPESWAEYCAEGLDTFPDGWLAQGPPLRCDRDHELGAACGICKDLRLEREKWAKHRAIWEDNRDGRRSDIEGCRICDGSGRVWVDGAPEFWYCDHGFDPVPLSTFGAVSTVPPPNNGSVVELLDVQHHNQ